LAIGVAFKDDGYTENNLNVNSKGKIYFINLRELTLANYVIERLYVDQSPQQEVEEVLSQLKGKILSSE
jgi:hypothetical protein